MLAGLGRTGTEEDFLETGPRSDAENFIIGLADRGVRSAVVRIPPITHSSTLGRAAFAAFAARLISMARSTGIAGFLGGGDNRLPAVNTADAAVLYRLAFEHAPAGSRLHAVAEDGVPMLDIAEAVGEKLHIPTQPVAADDADVHFGFLARMVALDNPTASIITRGLLNWTPLHPGIIEDLNDSRYYATDEN